MTKLMRLVAGPAAPCGEQLSTPGRIKNTLSPTIQNIAASWTKSGQQPDAFCKTQPTTSTAEFARIFLKRERQGVSRLQPQHLCLRTPRYRSQSPHELSLALSRFRHRPGLCC